MKRRLLFLLAVAVTAWSAMMLVAPPASAHDCSSDSDCEQTGGYNGAIAVVGGIAAVAAAVVAAAAKMPKPSGGAGVGGAPGGADGGPDGGAAGGGPKDEEEMDLSILQVDTDKVSVDEETSAVVTLTGWHAGKDQQPVRVPMSIGIAVPPGCGLTVTPDQGEGQLIATIAVDTANPPQEDQVELTATGTWKGKDASQTITVSVGGDYELKLY